MMMTASRICAQAYGMFLYDPRSPVPIQMLLVHSRSHLPILNPIDGGARDERCTTRSHRPC